MTNINCMSCDYELNINSLYKKSNKQHVDYGNAIYCNKCNAEYVHYISDYIKSFCYFHIKKKNILKHNDTLIIRFYTEGLLTISYDNNDYSYFNNIGYATDEIPKDPINELSIQYKYYLKYIDNIIFA